MHPLVAGPLGDCQSLVEVGHDLVGVVHRGGMRPHDERERKRPVVPAGARDRNRFLAVPKDRRNVARAGGAELSREESARTDGCWLGGARQREQARRPLEPLVEPDPVHQPERSEDPKPELRLILRLRPRERRADVVALVREAKEPRRARVAVQVRLHPLGPAGVELGVPPRRLLAFAAHLELLACELEDRLEHLEPRRAIGGVPNADEVVLDERRQLVEDGSATNRLCRLDRAAAAEDRQAPEDRPLVVAEEVVAPRDRGA